jgi:hypothetical protein
MLDVGQAPVMPAAAPVNPHTARRPSPPAPFMPGDTGLPPAQSQQSFMPAAGDRSDDAGAPIKTGR